MYKKFIYSLIGLFITYSLLGFFLVPYVAKKKIQDELFEIYSVRPNIQKLHFNPFTFNVHFEKFDMTGLLAFDSLEVDLTLWPILKKEIRLSLFDIKNLAVKFVTYKDGSINWKSKASSEEKNPSDINDHSSPWVLHFDLFNIEAGAMNIQDETHATPMYLDLGPINLKAVHLSTSLDAQTALKKLSINIGERGVVSIGGSMTMTPFSAALDLDIKHLPMDFLTAYLSDQTNLEVLRGEFNLVGHLKYELGSMLFTGKSGIEKFSLVESGTQSDVLSFGSLTLNDIKFSGNPTNFSASLLDIENLKTKVQLRKDGTLNFKHFMKPVAKNESTKEVENTAKHTKSSVIYNIDKVQFKNGTLDYADEQIRPHFYAKIHELNGSVAPISSDQSKKIQIALKGMVEKYGKFNADGYVIPSVPRLELKTSFKNIEMTTFTPYSNNFLGYEISKGKLFLDFMYELKKTKIVGKNFVILDQFTLGNEVPGKKTTNLPVRFALALMKDRHGKIQFKLPVEGDVSSPSFKLSNLIWTALKNMLINIVAAPFDFVSGLVNGEDIKSIKFAPKCFLKSPGKSCVASSFRIYL